MFVAQHPLATDFRRSTNEHPSAFQFPYGKFQEIAQDPPKPGDPKPEPAAVELTELLLAESGL